MYTNDELLTFVQACSFFRRLTSESNQDGKFLRYIWSSYGNFGYTCFNSSIIALEPTFPGQINIYVIITLECLAHFTTQQSS